MASDLLCGRPLCFVSLAPTQSAIFVPTTGRLDTPATATGKRKCADTIGTVPVPWADHFQINGKMLMYFSNKIYGSNFIKRHSETVCNF